MKTIFYLLAMFGVLAVFFMLNFSDLTNSDVEVISSPFCEANPDRCTTYYSDTYYFSIRKYFQEHWQEIMATLGASAGLATLASRNQRNSNYGSRLLFIFIGLSGLYISYLYFKEVMNIQELKEYNRVQLVWGIWVSAAELKRAAIGVALMSAISVLIGLFRR